MDDSLKKTSELINELIDLKIEQNEGDASFATWRMLEIYAEIDRRIPLPPV